MEVILIQDVENLGFKYDTVTVKGGYGRNFLLPKKMAVVANKTNAARIGEIKRQIDKKEGVILAQIQEVVNQLQAASIKIGAKVGTSGKIFGSVTNVQLAEAIKVATGAEVDRRKISIKEDVKTVGTYSADIVFHPKVKESIEFEVIAE